MRYQIQEISPVLLHLKELRALRNFEAGDRRVLSPVSASPETMQALRPSP